MEMPYPVGHVPPPGACGLRRDGRAIRARTRKIASNKAPDCAPQRRNDHNREWNITNVQKNSLLQGISQGIFAKVGLRVMPVQVVEGRY